jgi:ankyrin repeat protein
MKKDFDASAGGWDALLRREAAPGTASPDLAAIRKAISEGADVNAKMNWGAAAIIYAATNGQEGVVDLLIRSGANLEERTYYGYTALMYAAMSGHGKVVDRLLKAGADPFASDVTGQTARQYAATAGHDDIAAKLKTAEESARQKCALQAAASAKMA